MIKIENIMVTGWGPAIRGARNPMNSWEKSDSLFVNDLFNTLDDLFGETIFEAVDYFSPYYYYYYNLTSDRKELFSWAEMDLMDLNNKVSREKFPAEFAPAIGPNDLKLLTNLAKAGSDEAKFRRMIVVYVDITAPMYWWKEADTYKVGTVRNSCSTMHKIHAKEFGLEDFSHEQLISFDDISDWRDSVKIEINEDLQWRVAIDNPIITNGEDQFLSPVDILKNTIRMLNKCRASYLQTKDKKYWYQMIQLLPSSYNQRATLMLNYEVLANMYHARKNHKLDEWRNFCAWIETLPYAKELIVGGE